jgi:hypothetical protein
MKWLRRKDTISLAWKYAARGSIWRLLSSERGALILEERDIAAKELRLTSLDGGAGTILWSTERYLARWWLSIETLHGDTLFLHEYATPDMPDHKSVIALNLADGAQRWSNDEMKFLFAHERAVYVSKDSYDGRSFYELDIATGEVLREVDDATVGALRPAGEPPSGVLFPVVVPWGENGAPEPSAAVMELVGRGPLAGEVEIIDAEGRWLIGWHERITPDDPASPLRHRFMIADAATQSVLYRDEIDSKVNVPVPDLFIRRNEMAYYIRERETLCAVRLAAARRDLDEENPSRVVDLDEAKPGRVVDLDEENPSRVHSGDA